VHYGYDVVAETPMVIIMLLASLNSCVNPWIYLSFTDHVTVSWLCRQRAAKARGHGASSGGYNTAPTTATTRDSRPGTRLSGGGGDTPLRRLSRPPPARSVTINDGRRPHAAVDL